MPRPSDPARVRLLVLDADGTLTDGGIHVDGHGVETKRFHVRDGFGMRAWMRSGRELAVVTGRGELALRHRLADLGVPHVVTASGPKGVVLDQLLERLDIPADEVAAMGDDLPDMPLLARVGYPMAVADAVPEVREMAAWVASAPGGHGAVREGIEHLLRAAGAWQAVVEAQK
ncbi:MAG: KdsC family phosphatase [Phycisphaerales bacterium]|jgi:YrbI family 3-deoxy-D-manno-octulosonate 8-phosphate phosphatase